MWVNLYRPVDFEDLQLSKGNIKRGYRGIKGDMDGFGVIEGDIDLKYRNGYYLQRIRAFIPFNPFKHLDILFQNL